MPIPVPGQNEDESEFISRCMTDDVMLSEYPASGQRLAICYSSWEGRAEKADSAQLSIMDVDLGWQSFQPRTLLGSRKVFDEFMVSRHEKGRFSAGGGTGSGADQKAGTQVKKSLILSALRKVFDESQHPRDELGRFTAAGGGTGSRLNYDKDSKSWVGGTEEEARRLKELKVGTHLRDVRLNPDPSAALQAIGIDSKGRKQYIYSAEHTQAMMDKKHARLEGFNKVAVKISDRAGRDMQDESLSVRQRDTAAAVRLIASSAVRIGSDNETFATKKAYGATTLQGEHVRIDGDTIHLSFPAKSGKHYETSFKDPALASYLRSKDLKAGDRVFATTDSAARDYFKKAGGEGFKVHDYRMYHGTRTAIKEVKKMPIPKNKTEYGKARMAVAKVVAAKLGNTPKIALDAYIHPGVFAKWEM